jgi:hypothetical protein
MSRQFFYSITTNLSRDQVWELLTNIEEWTNFSAIYADLRWSGFPWVPGSCITGRLTYPIALVFRYLVKECEAPKLMRYMAQSAEAGFAVERAIRLEQLAGQTLIRVTAFTAGNPTIAIPGGSLGFLKMITERWFQDFALFCEKRAQGPRFPLLRFL